MTAPKTALADPTKLPNFLTWLEALRSGEFVQASGVLRRGPSAFHLSVDSNPGMKHCCLGVATELACRAGVEPVLGVGDQMACKVGPEHVHDLWCVRRSVENLAPEVAQWLGLDPNRDRNPVIGWSPRYEPDESVGTDLDFEDCGYVGASTFNDEGTGFDEIAARLEAVYLNGKAPAAWVKEREAREAPFNPV